jgi:hypothetical protein
MSGSLALAMFLPRGAQLHPKPVFAPVSSAGGVVVWILGAMRQTSESLSNLTRVRVHGTWCAATPGQREGRCRRRTAIRHVIRPTSLSRELKRSPGLLPAGTSLRIWTLHTRLCVCVARGLGPCAVSWIVERPASCSTIGGGYAVCCMGCNAYCGGKARETARASVVDPPRQLDESTRGHVVCIGPASEAGSECAHVVSGAVQR